MGFSVGKVGFSYISMKINEIELYVSECIGNTEVIPGNGMIIDDKTIFRKMIIRNIPKCIIFAIEKIIVK